MLRHQRNENLKKRVARGKGRLNLTSIRAVVFGAGRRGNAHSAAVADLESRGQVIGIADLDESRARTVAGSVAPHAKVSTDALSLLNEVEPDLVYITTPPAAHLEQTLAALERGAHVVLEKPIVLNVHEADIIGEAADKAGKIVHVCHQLRYLPGVHELIEILKGQRVALSHIWLYRMAPDIPGNWNRNWGGGHVVEWGIHYLDLCRYLMGTDATEVHARYADVVLQGQPNWDNWDAYAMNLQWANGAIGGYASTYALKPGIQNNGGLRIIAEEGMAEFDWMGCRWITPDGTQEWTSEQGSAERDLSSAMFDAIEQNDPSLIRQSYADAVRTHRLVMGANESAETGTIISLR
ncbi:MAG: gfo/Idh/MocA family oxidoreductase [Sphaerobacteraceae bacterium]|nr:MAG: gfo/Idh/MocA family oxidoreductase [Sphaerobacteraceae bacterium]